jgi:hypothetical protein
MFDECFAPSAEFTTDDGIVSITKYEAEPDDPLAFLFIEIARDDGERQSLWLPLEKVEWALRSIKRRQLH